MSLEENRYQFHLHSSKKHGGKRRWYFNLRAGNGEKVLQSEMYSGRQKALTGISLIQQFAANAAVIVHEPEDTGRPVRTIKKAARNRRPVAVKL